MHIESHHDDSPGAWVQLERGSAGISLGRWPGPVGPGINILTTDGGHFAFAAVDRSDDSPVVVLCWVSDTP